MGGDGEDPHVRSAIYRDLSESPVVERPDWVGERQAAGWLLPHPNVAIALADVDGRLTATVCLIRHSLDRRRRRSAREASR